VDPDAQFITTITVAEIVYGAYRSRSAAHHMRNLERVLLPQVSVLDFDVRASYLAGRLRAELERAGRPLPFVDIQIAAIALARDLTLVTGNTRHFAPVPGLTVENWM
jgi:tRNA(fMet)-specific endonuclease VapC